MTGRPVRAAAVAVVPAAPWPGSATPRTRNNGGPAVYYRPENSLVPRSFLFVLGGGFGGRGSFRKPSNHQKNKVFVWNLKYFLHFFRI